MEDIFGNELESETTVTETPTETPAETPAPAQAQPDYAAVITDLQRGQADMQNSIKAMASSLQSIFTNAASSAETPAAPGNANDLVTDLASRGDAALTERVDKRVTELANTQLAPHLQGLTETIHDSLVATAKAGLDVEFGDGTWDKLIKEGLEQDIQNLRGVNYRAIADKRSIQALIDRHIGLNYKALRTMEAEKVTKDKEKAAAKNTTSNLPGGRSARIMLNDREPDANTQQFFNEIESATGEKTDVKSFMALHNVGNTLTDYLNAVNATKKPARSAN